VDKVSPTDNYEVRGSLGGPVPGLKGRASFFASGRILKNEGFLYGQRIVQPISAAPGTGEIVSVDGRNVFVPALGDSSFASMNWGDQSTGQLKFTTRLFGNNRLTANLLLQQDEGQGYDHNFRYNPGGIPTTFGNSQSLTVTYTQVFGTSSFMDVKGAFFTNRVESFVYENPLDPRYPQDNALRQLGGNFTFFRGGARMNQFRRETESLVGRIDFTSQVSRQHLVKAGIGFKSHDLFLDDFEIKNNASTGFAPSIPAPGTPDHVLYTENPLEASAFVQDKMEFDFMVVNAGIRLDYFDPRSEVLEDYGRPRGSARLPTSAKWQLSPRIGLAYPLSELGVVHVAYGRFFQMPPFQFLFTNPDYIYDPEEGVGRAFGYADLEPQRTVAYEIGLQQAVSGIVVETTAYFKDIRNLLGSRIEVISPGFDEPFQLERYGRFINRDYGQVKGFILTIERPLENGFGFNVDYTFQVAQGNASDPRSVLLDEQAGIESEKQLVPLDWDRRHQLNTTLTIGDPGIWVATLTGRMGSGLPYTPSLADERIGLENSGRRRGTATFDLFAKKDLSIAGLSVSAFTRVFNLFDTRNEIQVFSDTGRAFPNLRFLPGEAQGLNTKDEYLERPDFFSAPRQVTIGLSTRF
jgi:TonB-dependent receptor-like protein